MSRTDEREGDGSGHTDDRQRPGSSLARRVWTWFVGAVRWWVDVFRGHAGSRHLNKRDR